jgi:hypothetical protein
MSQAASRSRTVFRACVVSAVREGETLMGKLVEVTRNALTQEESSVRNIQQRNNISDALGALKQHEAAMVKGYPMALLEIFAEGPANGKARAADESGMDFGELSLMDESEMQDQVELSKAQQQAVHATEAVLAELNTLVSSAQGLRSVQPERNPLRPENYIRALQRVVSETGATSEVRQLWMPHMRGLLGKLLEVEYQRMAKSLREQGIEPVGYAVLGTPTSSARNGYAPAQGMGTGYGGGTGYSTAYGQPSGYGGTTGYGGNTGYGRGMGGHTGWQGESMQPQMAAEAEEAILTVGILRQMLAGGDPFDPRGYVVAPSQPGALPGSGWVDARAAVPSAHAGMGSAFAAVPAVAADAMEDIAQLERLVNRLAGGSQAAPLTAWRPPPQMVQPIYTVPFVAPTESPVVAAEVVGRMMAALAQDTRLLPAMQKAVQNLEPALKQLVRFDPRFFTDAGHPARRLLDEMTQRSLAFASEDAPGFAQFVRLVNEAVTHLAASQIKDATPFETVLKALYSAWDTQEQRVKAKEAATQKARQRAEQRAMLAEKISADIRKLPDMGQVPADVLNFAAGPWADVVALAQVSQQDGAEDDPGGYLALVPMLLWSAQPELTRAEPERLTQAIPDMLAKLREGLGTINYPAAKTSAFLEQLVALHQSAFEMPMPSGTSIRLPQGEQLSEPLDSMGSEMPSEDSLQAVLDSAAAPVGDAPADPFAHFVVGAWVELITNQRPVRTQLTWASPNGTLFLFTSPDGSTQSMTRRMRDKLASEGTLRVVRVKSSSRSANSAPAELSRSGKKIVKGR